MPTDVSPALKIAVLQMNPVVGDLKGNSERIVHLVQQSYASGARLVITPELALSGYPPEDLLLRDAFIQKSQQALQHIARQLAGVEDLFVVIGHPAELPTSTHLRTASLSIPNLINAASVLHRGQVLHTYAKRELPNYQVFDEKRYFIAGKTAGLGPITFTVQGHQIGLLICEDAWFEEPARLAVEAGAELLIVLNASPFHSGKALDRENCLRQRALTLARPFIYAHLVGGQDELIFDGASFAINAKGQVVARAPSFIEDILLMQFSATQFTGPITPLLDSQAELWQALVIGVRDYVTKNGFPGVLIGLSGGIDSALVLALAVDALGADKVRTVMMPSPYTADISWLDAQDMADRLGIRHEVIQIHEIFNQFKTALSTPFANLAEDTTEENIQARIRGTLLMALSNKTGWLVLTTGNKSEMATGYCTLYGDMAGGFAVIKDLLKTKVYELAQWRNQQAGAPVIPVRIIQRPPSAELRPNQIDQDSLPDYPTLDKIIEHYMEQDKPIEDIIALGMDADTVLKIVRLIKINEYKRRQAPVGIRVTYRAFGKDWRYPITAKYSA